MHRKRCPQKKRTGGKTVPQQKQQERPRKANPQARCKTPDQQKPPKPPASQGPGAAKQGGTLPAQMRQTAEQQVPAGVSAEGDVQQNGPQNTAQPQRCRKSGISPAGGADRPAFLRQGNPWKRKFGIQKTVLYRRSAAGMMQRAEPCGQKHKNRVQCQQKSKQKKPLLLRKNSGVTKCPFPVEQRCRNSKQPQRRQPVHPARGFQSFGAARAAEKCTVKIGLMIYMKLRNGRAAQQKLLAEGHGHGPAAAGAGQVGAGKHGSHFLCEDSGKGFQRCFQKRFRLRKCP